MTENENRKVSDYLMTCFVIHVSLLSYTLFLETAVLQKKACRLPPTYKFELGISWFSINHRIIDNHFSYEKVSCLKLVLRKRRYTENLLLKYVVRRVILVYRPHSLEGRDLSFCMRAQRRDSSKGQSWFGRLNQVLETTTMR